MNRAARLRERWSPTQAAVAENPALGWEASRDTCAIWSGEAPFRRSRGTDRVSRERGRGPAGVTDPISDWSRQSHGTGKGGGRGRHHTQLRSPQPSAGHLRNQDKQGDTATPHRDPRQTRTSQLPQYLGWSVVLQNQDLRRGKLEKLRVRSFVYTRLSVSILAVITMPIQFLQFSPRFHYPSPPTSRATFIAN